jgi:hypothetical protein
MTANTQEMISALNDLVAIAQQFEDQLSPENKRQFAELLSLVTSTMEQQEAMLPQGEQPLPAPQIPEEARLLWILSGGEPTVFADYLNQFPNDVLNQIGQNPTQINLLVTQLQRELPQGEPGSKDGIPQAPLQSSNVYGFQYDPRNAKLRVRFQEGGVYEYDNVPPVIFQLFASGAVPAKTRGQNKYGKWWKGKRPSIGSSFFSLVRKGGYPYKRLK